MILIAHVLGVPLEEYALPWIGSGAGAGLLMVLTAELRNLTLRRRIK